MRTTQTNKQPKIDLFVSIHANAAKSPKISGIETFCMQPSLFKQELKIMNKHEHTRHTASTRALHGKSRKLAMAVQSHVLTHARKHNKQVVDRKVKYSPAQVLMGLEAPAVLVELGFLSHPGERKLLQSDTYQKSLAQGIYKGIETFLQ
ncbi:MAG: N-acetylmuramoyl-L-alanine amidase [Alteromonas naphthalenivorans]|jgi:N-acetylmuramoyl-L-alanine amidase